MRITFVLPQAGLSGGVRVVAIYADRLQQRGHEVTVVSLPPRPLTLKNKVKTFLKTFHWPHPTPKPSHLDHLPIDHRVLETHRPIVDSDVPEADVIIATWWETAEWVNRLSPSKGKKFYFIQHHEVFENLPIDRVRATYHLPLRQIAVSQWIINTLELEYGLRNVHLVPNSVDFNFFNAPERTRQQRPTLGFIYSPATFKGCDLTIAALNKVRQVIPNLRILAFGSSRPSTDLPLPQQTEFMLAPAQDKIPTIYASCDYWIFSSRAEGFGLPILESMACGTPVIATKAGAAPELVGNGGGILLKGWNAEEMSAAIVAAFETKEKDWQKMSSLAREIASCYSWDDATTLFEQALQS